VSQAVTQALRRLQSHALPRWLASYVSSRFTPAGQALLVVWVVSAGQGAVSLELPIYHVWAFVTVTLGLAWLLSWWAVPRLHLVRRPLSHTSAGEVLRYEVEVENRSRRAAYALTVMELHLPPGLRPADDWEPGHIPRLGPGETAVLPMQLHCATRGAYTLRGLYAASAFPLGLWRGLRRASQESAFLVYPAFTTPASFPAPEGRQYQPGGMLLSSKGLVGPAGHTDRQSLPRGILCPAGPGDRY
jgi:uncharacterized protein (DUF58 family)